MLSNYFKVSTQYVFLVTGGFFHTSLLADEIKVESAVEKLTIIELQVKPAKCVALNQGRTCFAKVSFTWQGQYNNKLCLYQKKPREQISCWQPLTKQSIEFEFESNETKHYQLINHQQKVLAETTIEVNWVYDSGPKKRRWRVF